MFNIIRKNAAVDVDEQKVNAFVSWFFEYGDVIIDSVENLQKKLVSFDVVITVSEPVEPELLQDLDINIISEYSFELKLDLGKATYTDLIQKLAQRGFRVVSIKEKASRLEQYFMYLRDHHL